MTPTTGFLAPHGHSAGDQLLGLAPAATVVDRIATVATQSGYWRTSRAPERYRLWVLWHLVLHAAVRVTGKLAGGSSRSGRIDVPHPDSWSTWSL